MRYNKNPGVCCSCGKPVGVGEGINARVRGVLSGWSVRHKDCEGASFLLDAEQPIMQRVMARVDVSPEGCWLWQGAKDSHGYGAIYVRLNGKLVMQGVHRVVCGLSNRPLLRGEMACHTCDVRSCVNPAHLYIGNAVDNVRDMWARGRAGNNFFIQKNSAKTHCLKGHPYDEANTAIVVKSGRKCRECRTCARESARRTKAAYRARLKERAA